MDARRRKLLNVVCGVTAFAVAAGTLLACFDVGPDPNDPVTCEKTSMTRWDLVVPIEYNTSNTATLKWYAVEKPLGMPPPDCADVTGWGDPFATENAVTGCATPHHLSETTNPSEAAGETWCWKVVLAETGGSPFEVTGGEVLCESE